MKCLLINPPWPGKGYGTRSQNRIIKHRADKFLQYPLFMSYAASNLRENGHDVTWYDAVIKEVGLEETLKWMRPLQFDMIMMETTTPSILADFDFMRKVKGQFPNIFLIAVGQHVTAMPVQSLQECAAIDVVIKGEFDPWVSEVLANKADLSKVSGIAFRKGAEVFDGGPVRWEKDLDKLPFPARDIVPINDYGEAWYNVRPFTTVQTTRGCPQSCTFCISNNVMEGRMWRTRSIPNVIAEIKELVEFYCVKEINIDDPTFTIRPERAIEFCKALHESDIKLLWTANARFDTITRDQELGHEMLEWMCKSGCKMLRFGVEASTPEVLKAIKKNLTLDQIREGVKMVKKHKILCLCGFMFGFWSDSKESIQANLDFVKEIKPDVMQTSIALPFPGTPLYEEAKAMGKLNAKQWSDFDMTHGVLMQTVDMDKEYLEGILKKMYSDFYFRPSFYWQTLRNIRRWSDIPRLYRSLKTLIATQEFYSEDIEKGRVVDSKESKVPVVSSS
ncbi:radical SAM protein [Candidatus Woesearchaeota archaeon]|nr:radical SAM protein [Candidatus Woesearchaeota archaeon]